MGEVIGVVFASVLGGGLVIAWLTHVVVCLKMAMWGFLIAGAIFFPIAIVHGIGIWFGYWPGIWW